MKTLSKAERGELLELGKRRGLLKPEDVLTKAKDPTSALHKRFTWDDTEAALQWRLSQAQDLIMRVKVEVIPAPGREPVRVRAFVSIDEDRVSGGGYRSIEKVMSDAGLRAAVLRTALAELEAMQRRYQHLEELSGVFAAVDVAKRKAVAKAKAQPRSKAA